MVLNIFGKKIKVLKKKKLAENHNAYGAYIPDQNLIVIDAGLVGNAYLQTVIHETIHAILDRSGICQGLVNEQLEEIICENISTAMMENFKIKPL